MEPQPKQIECLPNSVMIFGCGYLGAALASQLIDRGVTVGGLTRNPEKAARLRELGLSEVIEGQLDSNEWHAQLQGNYQAVVNCVSSAGGGVAGYRKSYLDGQRSILKWTTGQQIQTYIYTSSTSVYPQGEGARIDESADTSDAPDTGQVLLASEDLLAEAAAQFRRWYVFRLAGIYGPQRHYLLNLLRRGERVIAGSGAHHLNLIHRDDAVAAILQALQATQLAPSGIYNLSDDTPVTKAALMEWLAKRIGVEAPTFDPDLATPRLQRRGGRMPDRIILNRKAKAGLGWQPQFASFQEAYDAILSQEAPTEL